MAKAKAKKTTAKKQEETSTVGTVKVPITIGFNQEMLIGVAEIIIGEHLTILPNMVLAPSFEIKDIEFNEKGESIKRELNLIELSMVSPQIQNATKFTKAEE